MTNSSKMLKYIYGHLSITDKTSSRQHLLSTEFSNNFGIKHFELPIRIRVDINIFPELRLVGNRGRQYNIKMDPGVVCTQPHCLGPDRHQVRSRSQQDSVVKLGCSGNNDSDSPIDVHITHLLRRKFKCHKMLHDFRHHFLVLFTKPIKIWGVPEMGDWEIFVQLQKFQVK